MTQGLPACPEPVLPARLRREPSARTNSDRAAHLEEAHSGAEGRLEGLARIAKPHRELPARRRREVPAVNRVVGACPEPSARTSRRDITSKPPGTIEWE